MYTYLYCFILDTNGAIFVYFLILQKKKKRSLMPFAQTDALFSLPTSQITVPVAELSVSDSLLFVRSQRAEGKSGADVHVSGEFADILETHIPIR